MTNACPVCEAVIAPSTGPGRRPIYCSSTCSNRASYLRRREAILLAKREASASRRVSKECRRCGAPFVPGTTVKQVYCSRACNVADHRDSDSAVCSSADCGRPVRAKGLCNSHYKAAHPNRKSWKKGKPETRRANLRRKTQQRRARMKGQPEAELIDRDAVGDRDEWRCGLCSTSVNRLLEYPDPESPSLDHVVPLSLGGAHVLSNVQISHLRCNVAKGNRVPQSA